MKRKALLIMNPGVQNQNFAPTVCNACLRYKNYLQSPVGGYWQNDEILELERLDDGLNLKSNLESKLKELNSPDIEYSLIIFVGHGGAANGLDSIQLEDGTIISIENLKNASGNPNPIKRTVVVDACRCYAAVTPQQLILEQREFSGSSIDGLACREFYNRLITESDSHIELIQSTQYGQFAHASQSGTAFIDALFDVIGDNNIFWNQSALMDNIGECSKSFPDILDDVKEKMTAYNQVPKFTSMSSNYFPLFALKRATTRNIEGGQVVAILQD